MFKNKKVLIYVMLCFITLISVFSFSLFKYKNELSSYNDYEGNLVDQMSCVVDKEIADKDINICSFNAKEKVDRLYVSYKQDEEIANFFLIVDKNDDVKTIVEDEWKSFSNNTVFTMGRGNGFKHYAEVKDNLNNVKLVFYDDDDDKVDEIRTESSFNFNWMHVIAISGFLIFIITLLTFYKFFVSNIELTFLFVSVFIGIIMVIIVPPFSMFDEAQHFIKAYTDNVFELGDIRTTYLQQNLATNSIVALNKGSLNMMFESALNSQITNVEPPTTAALHMSIAYFANSFGISLGKIFTVNFVILYYLGRLSNVIVYSLISYFLLKYTKVFKLSTFALLLLPTSLFFKTAFSLDFVVLMSFLTVFLITFNILIKGDDNASKFEYIFFALASVMLVFTKIPYLIFILIFFIIPKKKDISLSNWLKPRVYIAIVVIIAIIVSSIYQKYNPIVQWNLDKVDPDAQLRYMFDNPLTFLRIWYEHALSKSGMFVKTVISEFGYNGYIMYNTGGFNEVITSLLFIGLTAIVIYDTQFIVCKLKKRHRLIIIILIMLSYMLIVAALYITFNSVGAQKVLGVQVRYISPFFLPLVVALAPNLKISKDKLNKSYQYVKKYVMLYAMICVVLTFAYFIGYLA